MLLAIIIICAAWIFIRGQENTRVAIITVDGKTVKTVNLETAEDCVFSLEEVPEVTICVKSGEIAFVNSKCPDGLCEKSGFLKKTGDTAACLPFKTVITVRGEKSSVDGVSY